MYIRQAQDKQKITPFLWFDKRAEEAVNFYVSIFEGNPLKKPVSRIVSITRYPEGMGEGPMKDMEGKVLTAVFELEGQQIMALDGRPIFKPTAANSLYVDCASQEEVDYFWNKLGEGSDPSTHQCGWLATNMVFTGKLFPVSY